MRKNTIFIQKTLQVLILSCILDVAVTLIALKREVAADYHHSNLAGFPWSECQVRKLATSHCNTITSTKGRNKHVNFHQREDEFSNGDETRGNV